MGGGRHGPPLRPASKCESPFSRVEERRKGEDEEFTTFLPPRMPRHAVPSEFLCVIVCYQGARESREDRK